MDADNLTMGGQYRNRAGREGALVRIEGQVVTLQDIHGDSLVVPLHELSHALVFFEPGAEVQLNGNYPAPRANAFLMIRTPSSSTGWDCAGGAELVLFGENAGAWKVDISKVPVEESVDDDCRTIGFFERQEDALKALWAHRSEAKRAITG